MADPPRMADMPLADKPASPFAGLDTSLLRSTRPRSAPEAPEAEPVARGERPVARQAASRPASRATTVSRTHDTTASDPVAPDPMPEDALEAVRRAVRTLGKEAATYRFTKDEKRALASTVYVYREQGIRTSENEITRIALNYLMDEYQRHGRVSILAQVLARLNQ